MPDVFSDLAKVTRLYILTAYMLTRIDVPVGRKVIPEECNVPIGCIVANRRFTSAASQSPIPSQKRGRLLGLKDHIPKRGETWHKWIHLRSLSQSIHLMKLFWIVKASWKRRVSKGTTSYSRELGDLNPSPGPLCMLGWDLKSEWD